MTRLHIPLPLVVGAELELPDAAARHLVQVLRMQAGEPLTVFNGEGGEYAATLIEAGRRTAKIRVERFAVVSREAPLAVTLGQAIAKGERMDFTLQKSVELGVTAIQPLLSARTVVRLDGERWEKKLEHWRGVVSGAAEQSGRTHLPPVAAPLELAAWLDTLPPEALKLILAPGAATSFKQIPKPGAGVCLLVGPEGGFSPEEIALAEQAGFIATLLGPRVLRTETAGLAALAALQTLWGDF